MHRIMLTNPQEKLKSWICVYMFVMVKTSAAKVMTVRGIAYGAIAGAIATWSLSSIIAATEVGLSFPIGTFYTILGISLGFANATTATFLAFGLHILTGTILGIIVGAFVIRMKAIFNPYKSVLVGTGTGVVIWLVLFLPVTTFLIQPSIQRITLLIGASLDRPTLSTNLSQFVAIVTMGAIAFHLLWGAIFGFIVRSLIRVRARSINPVGMNN